MPIKKTELHKLSDAEIVEDVDRQRKRLFELRAQAVTEKLENPRELTNIRRDIARLLTEQRSRQLKQETA
jgi:large subunit ribosomal protein L29